MPDETSSALPALSRWGPAGKHFGTAPLFDPEQGITILEPESAGPGYWVGAPSILWDAERESFLLTYRRRRPRQTHPDRGYVACIAESRDGVQFQDVWTVEKAAFGTTSMERFSLVREAGGPYRLYAGYVDPVDNRWRIDVLEADRPEDFDPSDARPALTAESTGTEGVKDPWVFQVAGLWHMLVSYAAPRVPDVTATSGSPGPSWTQMHSTADVYNTGVLVAPTGLAISEDGIAWRWDGEILGVGAADSWDAYQARLCSIVHRSPVWVGFYDGSANVQQNYEERCGLVYSADLRTWHRVTLSGPVLVSPEGSGSLRYVDAVEHEGSILCYYEHARADGSHELRMSRLGSI